MDITVSKIKTADPKAEEAEAEVPKPADDAAPPPEPEETDEVKASEDANEPGASEKKDEPAPRRLSRDPLIRVASLVTLIAAAAAAWFGWSYNAAAGNDDLAYAAERDRVLAAADQAIVNLNTLDHRNVDAGLKVWQDSTTAKLYDEIVKGRSRLEAEVKKAETTSSAKILESGLTELDTRAGKAAVIAAVRITITGAEGKPSDNIRRFAGQLTKTSSGWKLSALGQAPTGTP
ncbi:hypothetical protein [Spirillospora sp. NPDC077959]|uniref:hypothetical protein n=1 Tax=Spirillospora sp. NPDC077959 TaxID=3364529 RepID=UPI0037CF1E1C